MRLSLGPAVPASAPRGAATLARLERSRDQYGAGSNADKLALLRRLDRTLLATAAQVRRLHEVLCFLRAYPGDARVLAQVERMLARFERRPDLRAHRGELASSGIAGTMFWYPYFWPTACWLARRWPSKLHFDRNDDEAGRSLAKALPLLVTPVEAAALRELDLGGYAAIDRLRARRRSDAAFLVERVAALPGNEFTREAFYDTINPSCELLPAADTPARGREKFGAAPLAVRSVPPRRDRPELRAEMRRPPRALRRLPRAQGEQLIELARGAMAARGRDLDAFAYGSARDAWLVDDGDGLAFGLVGMQPARRAPLAAIYGGLTLRNGVPIGYLQADVAGRAAALSFNTFDTFRGAEAAFTFARLLAALRHAFGVDAFSIEPYQLGKGNDEGLASGAWWFYFKLGFRPRAAAARQLARAEIARRRTRPAHRSSVPTLRQLAAHPLFFDLDPRRRTPLPPLADVGLRAARLLAARHDDRAAALASVVAEAARALGLSSLRGLAPGQRRVLEGWAPLLLLAGVTRWSQAPRRAALELIRAKAAASERDYALLLAAHRPLCRVLLAQ